MALCLTQGKERKIKFTLTLVAGIKQISRGGGEGGKERCVGDFNGGKENTELGYGEQKR